MQMTLWKSFTEKEHREPGLSLEGNVKTNRASIREAASTGLGLKWIECDTVVDACYIFVGLNLH